jgi:hypothetical protein
MKPLLFLFGATIGVFFTAYIHDCKPRYALEPSKEVLFVLESVDNDTCLQKMIIDPVYRLRVKQAEKDLK